jgi:hypothetical protein
MQEILERWAEYQSYLLANGIYPESKSSGFTDYYSFFWFMEWCKNGTIPFNK